METETEKEETEKEQEKTDDNFGDTGVGPDEEIQNDGE